MLHWTPVTDDLSRQWICRNTGTLREQILTGTRKGISAYITKQTPQPEYEWLVITCDSEATIDDSGNVVQ